MSCREFSPLLFKVSKKSSKMYATSEQGKVGVALKFFGEVVGKVGVARIFSDFTTLF